MWLWALVCSRMSRWEEKAKRDAVQSGKGPGEFGPDYSDRKQYQLGRSPYPTHVVEAYTEETKMACNNIDCSCEGCTCDPCTCTPENLCGCDEKETVQRKSHLTGRNKNEWKGLI